MSNESETIEQVFYRCTSTDFSSRDREEILRAMQEYSDLQNAELKQTILDFIHDEKRVTLSAGEHKAFEKLYDFIESLGKKLQ